MQEACNKGYSCILILGDFNYKGITWENWNTPGLNDSNEEFLFVEALRDNYLNQHIMKPTRIRQGQEPSILDLVITNKEEMIKDLEYLRPLGKSDHIVITFNIKCHRMQDNREKISYCYDKADYEAMTKDER